MKWTSALAIYLLIWTVCLFMVLPLGVRTSDEANEEKVAGQADSAPVQPMMLRKVLLASAMSLVLFGLFWLAYSAGYLDY